MRFLSVGSDFLKFCLDHVIGLACLFTIVWVQVVWLRRRSLRAGPILKALGILGLMGWWVLNMLLFDPFVGMLRPDATVWADWTTIYAGMDVWFRAEPFLVSLSLICVAIGEILTARAATRRPPCERPAP